MSENIMKQHTITTLRSLRAVVSTDESSLDVLLVIDTALASLNSYPGTAATPAPAEEEEGTEDTQVVVPEGFDNEEAVTTFINEQFAGASDEEREAALRFFTRPEGEEEGDEGTFVPDIVGNVVDNEGNITSTVGSADDSIRIANEMVAEAHAEEGNGLNVENANASTIVLTYKRLDGEELRADHVDKILASNHSQALKDIMGNYHVRLNFTPDEDVSTREVILEFDEEENKLRPDAIIMGMNQYRGIASFPGIGSVQVTSAHQ